MYSVVLWAVLGDGGWKYGHVSLTQYAPHTEKHTLFFNIWPTGVTMTGRFGLPLGPFISRITY